ncbi:hypothetical protein SCHPADRAFT_887365 [Schizopora paradoxa]|uniref:Uncharacterized protein n=1 Tax=Schizopora paradoxa TaxID=27342 RepID=A0A0H2S5M8_9AGAM|nr:hypothetical protein SCHPADRAFT_887365 [Schizopora paradoxa]
MGSTEGSTTQKTIARWFRSEVLEIAREIAEGAGRDWTVEPWSERGSKGEKKGEHRDEADRGRRGIAVKTVMTLSRFLLVVEGLVLEHERATNEFVFTKCADGRPATWSEIENVLESVRVDEANAEANNETWKRRLLFEHGKFDKSAEKAFDSTLDFNGGRSRGRASREGAWTTGGAVGRGMWRVESRPRATRSSESGEWPASVGANAPDGYSTWYSSPTRPHPVISNKGLFLFPLLFASLSFALPTPSPSTTSSVPTTFFAHFTMFSATKEKASTRNDEAAYLMQPNLVAVARISHRDGPPNPRSHATLTETENPTTETLSTMLAAPLVTIPHARIRQEATYNLELHGNYVLRVPETSFDPSSSLSSGSPTTFFRLAPDSPRAPSISLGLCGLTLFGSLEAIRTRNLAVSAIRLPQVLMDKNGLGLPNCIDFGEKGRGWFSFRM